eukprot:11498-Heterococcus_DN1.PRE.3
MQATADQVGWLGCRGGSQPPSQAQARGDHAAVEKRGLPSTWLSYSSSSTLTSAGVLEPTALPCRHMPTLYLSAFAAMRWVRVQPLWVGRSLAASGSCSTSW